MKNIKLFLPLIIFVVLAVFLLKGLDRDPNALPSVLIGKPVPAFSLPDLNNPEATISHSIFEGRPALLNVWATWCPTCRVEHPFLLQLAKQGVRIIGMDYKDDDTAGRRWLVKLGNPYELTFSDKEGHLGVDLGVFGAPETYVIDHKGVIRAKHVGAIDERVWQELGSIYQQLVKEAQE